MPAGRMNLLMSGIGLAAVFDLSPSCSVAWKKVPQAAVSGSRRQCPPERTRGAEHVVRAVAA